MTIEKTIEMKKLKKDEESFPVFGTVVLLIFNMELTATSTEMFEASTYFSEQNKTLNDTEIYSDYDYDWSTCYVERKIFLYSYGIIIIFGTFSNVIMFIVM